MKLIIFTSLLIPCSFFLLCQFFLPLKTETPAMSSNHFISNQTNHQQKLIQQIHPNPPIPKSSSSKISEKKTTETKKPRSHHSCNPNSLVYIYQLPPKFNHDLLKDCQHLNFRTNMCSYIIHRGLGLPLPLTNWFATNQFTAELIFHARLENHPCRTHNPDLARLFYVPFYGGFHASSQAQLKNLTAKRALIFDLAQHLVHSKWWRRGHGRDHFMALGRTSWDFMRTALNPPSRLGPSSHLLTLPVIKNMSFLPVERHPWNGANQFAIPYPSYFHPHTSDQLTAWQRHVTGLERPHLFSFIGSTRKGKSDNALVRNEIVRQCQMSSNCTLLDCSVKGEENRESICFDPARILGVMTRSRFCLHPPGDSFTRRSIFDSFLAGCVPVFFTKHSAYDQYRWYLPVDGSSYSVLIEIENMNGNVKNIEWVLGGFTGKKVVEMRERLVALLPKVTYMHPNGSYWGVVDAVDVALDAFSKHVSGSKKSLSII